MKRSDILFLLLSVLSGCSGGDSVKKNVRPDTSVISVARRDVEIIVGASDTRAIEGQLLDIRAKESYMRANGLNATADLYIATVEDCIRLQAPALAKEMDL